MSRLSVKGVVIAFVVMLVVDIVAGVALLAVAMADASVLDMASTDPVAAMEAVQQNSAYLVSSLVVGLMTTAIGGYLAARIAKHDFLLNAVVYGVLGVILGLMFAESLPAWFNIAAFVLNVPAAVLGGHVAKGKALPA